MTCVAQIHHLDCCVLTILIVDVACHLLVCVRSLVKSDSLLGKAEDLVVVSCSSTSLPNLLWNRNVIEDKVVFIDNRNH